MLFPLLLSAVKCSSDSPRLKRTSAYGWAMPMLCAPWLGYAMLCAPWLGCAMLCAPWLGCAMLCALWLGCPLALCPVVGLSPCSVPHGWAVPCSVPLCSSLSPVRRPPGSTGTPPALAAGWALGLAEAWTPQIQCRVQGPSQGLPTAGIRCLFIPQWRQEGLSALIFRPHHTKLPQWPRVIVQCHGNKQ